MDVLDDLPIVVDIRVASTSTPSLCIDVDGLSILSPAQAAPYLGWSDVQRIGIGFNEAVSVAIDDLELRGTGATAEAIGFNYDGESNFAVWEFAEPLTADTYILTLEDSVVDGAGNALDGEWLHGQSNLSGNGLAGDAFRFRFDVLPGDVDGDRDVDSRDVAIIAQAVDGGDTSSGNDLNLDGQVDAHDLLRTEALIGGELPNLGPDFATYSTTVGADRLAVLTDDGLAPPSLALIDPQSGQIIDEIALPDAFRFLGVETLTAQDGTESSVVALGEHSSRGGIRLWVWDIETGSMHSVAQGRGVDPVDFLVFDNSVFVAGTQSGSDDARLWRVDVATGARTLLSVIDGITPKGLALDPVGRQIALLGENMATGGTRAWLFDVDGTTRGSIAFGLSEIADIEFTRRADFGTALAALRDNGGLPMLRVDVRDLDTTERDLITVRAEARGSLLDAAPDGRLVATAINPSHALTTAYVIGENGVEISGTFGSGFDLLDQSILTINGSLSVAVSQVLQEVGVSHTKTRDIENRSRISTVNLSVTGDPTRWFLEESIHGHTRIRGNPPEERTNWFDTDLWDNAGEYMELLGANVFTRHAVSFDEDPWWPSETPTDTNGAPLLFEARDNSGIALDAYENPLQIAVDNAWEFNTPTLAYYAETGDARLAEMHPEWVGRSYNGQVLSHQAKGDYLDITGPYGDVVLQRVLELADMGFSGVYFDFRHLPQGGIWGTQLEADYLAETGNIAPPIGRTAEYRDYMLFYQKRMAETFSAWEENVREQYPHFQFVISVTSIPALTRLEMGTDLLTVASPKSEFDIAVQPGLSNSIHNRNTDLFDPAHDIRQAFGWSLLRDGADEGRPHIWDLWSPNGDQDEAFVAAVATYGGIAALDILEEHLAPGTEVPGIASRAELTETFAFGNRISHHLADAEAASPFAVLWNETARNETFLSGDTQIWEDVNLPALGAFEAMTDLGLGPRVFADRAIDSGVPEGVTVMFVNDRSILSGDQLAAIAAFEAQGGTVVTAPAAAEWGTEAGYLSGLEALRMTLAPLAASESWVQVDGLPERVHAVPYTRHQEAGEDSVVVAITNDFTFRQESFFFDPVPADEVNPSPPPVPAGATIRVDPERFGNSPVSELRAYEAVSGVELAIAQTSNGFEIVLPEFERMAVVVVDHIGNA